MHVNGWYKFTLSANLKICYTHLMNPNQEFRMRCRAVIIHDNKLLTVRHIGGNFLALPGGHLEFGEDPKECVFREVMEELGIEPEIGRVVCVNTFVFEETKQSIELFFEIKNAADYLELENNHRSHAHEIDEYVWVSPEDEFEMKPEKFGWLFKEGKLWLDEIIFVKG